MRALKFHVGQEQVGLDIRRVHALVPRVRLTALSGAAVWLVGTFVYRGELVPVIDLYRFTGQGECPNDLSSRIILVRPREGLGLPAILGLLASHVVEIRDVGDTSTPIEPLRSVGSHDLGPVMIDGDTALRILDPERLLAGQFARGAAE